MRYFGLDVLGPFVRIPALSDQVAELNTCVMRIANLIVKADGHLLASEAERLRSVQATMERILRVSGPGAGTAPPERLARGETGRTAFAALRIERRRFQ
jgi:hypothetical protein